MFLNFLRPSTYLILTLSTYLMHLIPWEGDCRPIRENRMVVKPTGSLTVMTGSRSPSVVRGITRTQMIRAVPPSKPL